MNARTYPPPKSGEPWRLSATALAGCIAAGECSAREATESVLAHVAQVNPRINALTDVHAVQALQAADAADQAQVRGDALGPLHGVPVTLKVNVDTQGWPTTDGVSAWQDNMASEDSPVVASLREAGAIVVGRSNTPAFSLRWFTDNDIHGRTLNPFNQAVTPGGSSGGAAAAVATGMGAIALGSDYGGSIRYPAWACGVVGLRTTVGRIPSYKATAPHRTISNQQMSVQGPLTRTVSDARLALSVMSRGSALDPQWVPAPLKFPPTPGPLRVAVCASHPAFPAHPGVREVVMQAAQWLADAGCVVEEACPPHFEEAAHLWRALVFNDLRRAGRPAIEQMGDVSVQAALRHYLSDCPDWGRDPYLDGLTRRFSIARDWALFFERHPVLLMPNSWEVQFAVDQDTTSAARMAELLAAQSPQLAVAMLGLPGLSVPTGLVNGLPTGVQLVASRFREDLLLQAAEWIEAAAGFSVLDALNGSLRTAPAPGA